MSRWFGRSALLLLALAIAAGAWAQQPDPLTAAGLLQGQCQAIEVSAAAACGKLSGAVANGRDPSAGLPATDQIQPGDLHLFGPWQQAIVLRKDAAGWSALAVTGAATGPDIVVTQVADAAQAKALFQGKGIEAVATASSDPFGEGWITEVRKRASTDASKVGDDVLARYISPGGGKLDMGAFVSAMPVRWGYLDIAYVHDGLFRADQAGAYRFAVTFQSHDNDFTKKWVCYPHLAFVQGNDKFPVLQAEEFEIGEDALAEDIKSVVSSTVNMPVGFNAMEITVECTPDNFVWNSLGGYLHATANGGRGANPWPVLVLSVQRPGDSGFTPIRPGEILYPKKDAADALPLGQRPNLPVTDTLKELGLPASYKPGWFVDVFPVVGDQSAWSQPPSAPRQGTFIGRPDGFAVNDHIAHGLMSNGAPDRAGKIFVATSLFLAPKAGRYSFLVEAENAPVGQAKDVEDCVADLSATTPKGETISIIDGSKANVSYTGGAASVMIASTGGIDLAKGAYRMSLRGSCYVANLADITQSGYGATRLRLYIRRPGEQLLSPARDGDFVYKTAG
ncbi:MAG TPA: hypothetical protein VM689_09365 [Aliidongia sp.]|nr:hypothetical protein [Aliidongia sp.]